MFKCLGCNKVYDLNYMPEDITVCPYCKQSLVIFVEEFYDCYADLYPVW